MRDWDIPHNDIFPFVPARGISHKKKEQIKKQICYIAKAERRYCQDNVLYCGKSIERTV
jgi:hypothetical protein